MIKLISCLIIFSLLTAGWIPISAHPNGISAARTDFHYEADLFVKNGNNADKKKVIISHENGVLKINSPKNGKINKSFDVSSIKNADYSYSEKPQIKEAILSTLISSSWFFGLAFLFTKTKKHWLVLSTQDESLFFQLREDNYRRLLLGLNSNKISVEDLGDRDKKEKPAPTPKTDSDSTKSKTL